MTRTKSPREFAYEALLAVERDGRQSHLVIRDTLQKMKSGEQVSDRDRAFFLRLTEGTVEYRLLLDHIINRYSKTKTEKMRPGVREILRMTVYQILFMDSVPDRAAVNEAVNLAVNKGFAGLRGFVNGVLRTIVREKAEALWPEYKDDPVRTLSLRYSISEEILEAWLPQFGAEKTEAICRAFLEERPLAVHRFAPCDGNELKEYLTPTGILEDAFFLKKGMDPADIPGFSEGRLYVQDLSSQIAVAAAGIRTGDRVLDLCAAPGGKSMLAAERGAQVLARDLTEDKTALIRENAERLGLTDTCGGKKTDRGMKRVGIRVEAADASMFDPALEAAFDVVIADLPCSGFGVCGRKPEIKYKPYRETVTELAGLQRKILANAVRYIRPGGKMLYSTCTIAEEENGANVRWLLETYRCLQPAEPSEAVCELLRDRAVPVSGYGIQLLPGDGPWDGFFFSLFQKNT